jgi:Tol biopolymer transport system component
MSPEQVRGEEIDSRTDIFSFGAVLHEMASGRRAFAGDSSIAVMHAILNDEPVDLPAELPPILESIVRRCLQKEPARRFQSASDLQFALQTSDMVRAAPVSPPSKTARGRTMIARLLVCAVVVAAGAYWLLGYLHPTVPAEQNILRQITFDHGLTADPAISPDGKLLAFASDRAGAGKLDIWVKQIDGGDPVAVTKGPANDYQPTFSPDGTRIAFTSEREGGGIYVMPALGGEASLLVPKASQPRFSPDGQYLLYVTGVPTQRIGMGTAGSHLFAMPLTGGSPVELNKGCTIVTSAPIWTPDSRRTLFAGMCGGRTDMWAADLSGKGPQPTGWRDYVRRFHVEDSWLAGVTLEGWLVHPLRILVHARSGTADFLQSAAASSDGSPGTDPPARVTFGTGAEMQASSAANGRIAIGSLAYGAHIWGVPVDDSGHAIGPARQLTTELPDETQPALSDNGQHLIFVASKSVPPQLYGKDLTTGRLRRLSQDSAWIKTSVAIGRGGSEVLYTDISSTPMSMFAVPFAGGVPQKFALSSTVPTPSDWARNGNTLLLTQHPESSPGHFSIAAADTSNGKVIPLIQDPGHDVFEAHFSPDARWITFTVLDNSTSRVFIAPFRLAPIPPAEWIPITEDTAWTDKPRFSNDGMSILFSSDRDGFRCIWAQRLTPAMRPIGDQFAVFHSHGPQLSIRNGPLSEEGMSVGKGLLVFDQTEFKGNIWMLEPAPPGRAR